MRKSAKGALLIIVSACAFGSIPPINRMAIAAGGDAASTMIIRFAIVSIFFTAYLRIRGLGLYAGRKKTAGLLVLGFVCYSNVALLMFLAMKYISAALGSLILYTYPAMVMAGSAVFLGEKLSRKKIAALIISTTGCIVVLWGPLGNISIAGVVLAFLVAVAYSAYILGSKKLLSDIEPAVVSAWMGYCCLIFFCIFGAATGAFPPRLTAVNLAAGSVLAVWSTIIGFLCFLGGLKQIGAQNASIISTFEPLYTIILAWLLIGETISLQQIGGGLIIMSGVVVLNLKTGRRQTAAAGGQAERVKKRH